ncbi:MAG: hypothetical protein ABSA29_15815, partial [Terriglobales bacterium]
MMRRSFAYVGNLNLIFFFIAAFMLVAVLAASAQQTNSAPDYDRPWQHFAQAGDAQGSAIGGPQSDAVFRSPAGGKV